MRNNKNKINNNSQKGIIFNFGIYSRRSIKQKIGQYDINIIIIEYLRYFKFKNK